MEKQERENRHTANKERRWQQERASWELVDHVGRLSTSQSGWQREVNIVAWNGAAPRLDIRDWNPEHNKMGRGITLNASEVLQLTSLLQQFDPQKAGI